MENEKEVKISSIISKIENKETKILFFVPDTPQPNSSVIEIYTHATVLKKAGFKTYILTETKEYEKPYWVDFELTDHEYIAMENAKLTLGAEDILVIPEVFTNIMEQTKNLPCIRVAFIQSVDYMLSSLILGSDWSLFGIKDIITNSSSIEKIINENLKNKFRIQHYNIGVPEYFKSEDKRRELKISLVGRNQNDVMKVIKLFFLSYPQYSFITFDTMTTDSTPPEPISRRDFAEKLKQNFAAVWIDRIASFGTFPIECMKAGIIPIGIIPDLTPDYLLTEDGKFNENTGYWTDNSYNLHKLIYYAVSQYMDDSCDDEMYEEFKKISDKYTTEKSNEGILTIYSNLLNNRLENLKNSITKNEE